MKISGITAVAAISLAFVGLASCGSKEKTTSSQLQLTMTTIEYADSLTVGESSVKATAMVEYPQDGNAALLDSTRKWIAETLMPAMSEEPQADQAAPADLENGRTIVEDACKNFLEKSKSDLSSNESEDAMAFEYEYDAQVKNVYMTDSVVSLHSTIYVYMGGAHGATYQNASTFKMADGVALGYNIFDPTATTELTAMVKEALAQQYFEANDSFTLEEALIIDPQDFKLPALAPYFTEDGLTFVYQQYEITCYAAGMPTCTLPYAEVASYILPEFRSLLPVK